MGADSSMSLMLMPVMRAFFKHI